MSTHEPIQRYTDLYYSEVSSPLGTLLLTGNGKAITGLYMDSQKTRPLLNGDYTRDNTLFQAARAQLEAYFAGDLFEFDLPLAGAGTGFQQTVWEALRAIPYGTTETYGGLARRIGNEKASRAVGLANGRNPIGIIVPCHRVIGANGTLTGYAGGIERKKWLLAHEQEHRRQQTV